MAERVRETTNNGQRLMDSFVDVFDGKYPEAKVSDKLVAAKELTDRGWGKAPQQLELSGPGGGPLQLEMSAYSDVELRELVRIRLESLESEEKALSDGVIEGEYAVHAPEDA